MVVAVSAGKDENGRFAKGNQIGKGNEEAAAMRHYRKIFREFFTDEKFLEVVRAVHKKASKGDMRAANLIIEYNLGRTPPVFELYTPDDSNAVVDFKFTIVGAADGDTGRDTNTETPE